VRGELNVREIIRQVLNFDFKSAYFLYFQLIHPPFHHYICVSSSMYPKFFIYMYPTLSYVLLYSSFSIHVIPSSIPHQPCIYLSSMYLTSFIHASNSLFMRLRALHSYIHHSSVIHPILSHISTSSHLYICPSIHTSSLSVTRLLVDASKVHCHISKGGKVHDMMIISNISHLSRRD
jgi:hypothetical protein